MEVDPLIAVSSSTTVFQQARRIGSGRLPGWTGVYIDMWKGPVSRQLMIFKSCLNSRLHEFGFNIWRGRRLLVSLSDVQEVFGKLEGSPSQPVGFTG
jgi:hypothetical protein